MALLVPGPHVLSRGCDKAVASWACVVSGAVGVDPGPVIAEQREKRVPHNKRASNEEIVSAYKQTGSVWKAGKRLGLAGQSVHERLRALGYPMVSRKWTDEEVEEATTLAAAGLPAGEIAARLGRTFAGVTCKLSEVGVKIARATISEPKRGTGYDKANTHRHLRRLELDKTLRVTKYVRSVGLDVDMFVMACQRHFEERWDDYVASVSPIPKKKCVGCDREFHPNSGKQKYCTRRCSQQAKTDREYFGGKRRNTVGLAEETCQLCGVKKKRGLSSHHIFGKENDPENDYLIALCAGCHKIITLLGSRKFLEDPVAWQSLISLAWLRRHGDAIRQDPPRSLYVEVTLEVEEEDE